MSLSLPNICSTLNASNISLESKVLVGVQALVALQGAYDSRKQFAASATVLMLCGLARGYFELKKHRSAIQESQSDRENIALQRLNPVLGRNHIIALVAVVFALANVKRIPHAPARLVAWSDLMVVPAAGASIGYSLGVFIAREYLSRLTHKDGAYQVLLSGLKRQTI